MNKSRKMFTSLKDNFIMNADIYKYDSGSVTYTFYNLKVS